QGGQSDPSIHKKKRVGVVLFGGGAQTVMDLNHYTSNDNQGTYLSLADSVAKPSSTAYFPRIKANVTGGKTSGYMFADSTYLQGALYQGMNILANASFDGGSAGNTTGRVPVLVVLSDGGTNVVTASSVDGTRNAYTFDSTKAYNASNQTFTAFPVLTGVSWHNPYNGIVPVEGGSGNRRIWPLEGNPVYGSLNNENQLTPNLRSAIMMSNLLMAGSMQKRIEEHYRKGVADESKISMYGYSILLNSKALGNNEKEMMYATLDPVNYLKSNSQGPSGTAAGEGTLRDYACAKTAYSWLNEYVSGNTTVSKTATSNWGPTNGSKTKTATFNFDHLTGADEKYDINSIADVYYIDKSITTESGDLGVIFDQIIDEVTTNIFIPVGGGNDLGESNSVTYMDPMGKYMDVKDVKSLTLFGENYALAKTAMYSYAWNKLYLENSNDFDADKDVLPSGWYKGDPVEGDNSGVQKATGALPEGCATAKEAWNNGWVYRVGFKIATQFVPSLNEVSSPADINEEQKNTEYTFYRINASDQERKKLRMNPAFGTEENIPPRIQYNDNGEHLQTPGVYTLADLRVWVENTGDYNDSLVDNDVIQTDSNFDRALYVHIPANMLPIRAVTVNEKLTAGDSSFSSNQDSTFPLRLFYTVGIEDALLTDDGSLNITSGVNPTYIQNNKSTPETSTTDARNIDSDVGVIEFFSNWYNQERRYAVYDTASVREGDTTFGDPIVSFAPSVDNRYYVFEKALPLYSRAFIYENNQWNEVTFNSTGRVPTEFGGKLICQDLEVANLTNADTQITSALQAKGIQNVEEGNVVFLKSDRMSDVTRPNDGSADPFSSDDYYFMA
ncbi:MAG: hypothetical protein K2K01_03430, partial [Eubacterium sp.]|nr:hypothetical protein [Eubacterium sp.]